MFLGIRVTVDDIQKERVQREDASCISHSECLGQLRRGSIRLLVDLLHACRPSGTGDKRVRQPSEIATVRYAG